MLKAADIMKHDVISVPPDMPVTDLGKLFIEHGAVHYSRAVTSRQGISVNDHVARGDLNPRLPTGLDIVRDAFAGRQQGCVDIHVLVNGK